MGEETIDYVECAFCGNKWVRSEETFCQKCTQKLHIEMSIQSINTKISALQKIPYSELKEYLDILNLERKKLNKLVERIRNASA